MISSNLSFHINRKNLTVFLHEYILYTFSLLFGKDPHKQFEARFSETETNTFLKRFVPNHCNTYSCA